ncbi:MAG TPA: YggS family pyridoxal phosphate-dependent enzyme [Candidatus Limnocylindrales bacterium]|nr:YggS family pyridoxal phosphate-dependent enzyme [Candidatus Limnocylindrales bacterium]
MTDAIAQLSDARARVLDRIAEACARRGRDPADVRLVAVSKTVPPERLRAAVAAGLTTLGENRVQEALAKVDHVPGASWHLIGPLQSNKARRAVEAFGVIQSVDSTGLAERLSRLAGELRPGRPLSVLLQVNVDDDPAKAGFDPPALEAALPTILALPHLSVDGLMTIGRLVASAEEARPTFVALRELHARLRGAFRALGPELSMGMSDDYAVAVEEGATIVRVGRALFGERPSPEAG